MENEGDEAAAAAAADTNNSRVVDSRVVEIEMDPMLVL